VRGSCLIAHARERIAQVDVRLGEIGVDAQRAAKGRGSPKRLVRFVAGRLGRRTPLPHGIYSPYPFDNSAVQALA
jgi:hypothetical protein